MPVPADAIRGELRKARLPQGPADAIVSFDQGIAAGESARRP